MVVRAGGKTPRSSSTGAAASRVVLHDRETGGQPKYVQLAAILKERILRQEYKPDEQIPTEEQLCKEYDVSRITVREAITRLVQDAFLTRVQGRGTYVLPQKLRRDIARVYSFSEDMQRLGLRPSSEVLEQVLEQAEPAIAQRLALPDADRRVTRIRRLRKANAAPILVETTIVPAYLCPELVEEDLQNGSLYSLLEERYGLHPHHAEETYEAVVLGKADARLLGCNARTPFPAFAIQRAAFLEDGRPIELTRSLARGDRMSLAIQMMADKPQFQRLVGL